MRFQHNDLSALLKPSRLEARVALVGASLLVLALSANSLESQESPTRSVDLVTLQKEMVSKGWSLETAGLGARERISIAGPGGKKVEASAVWIAIPSFRPIDIKPGTEKVVAFEGCYIPKQAPRGCSMLLPRAKLAAADEIITISLEQKLSAGKDPKVVVFLQRQVETVGAKESWYEPVVTMVVFVKKK
ncbi:MAG: hypothetical protein WBF22_14055 [Methylocella sp.]